MKVQFIVTVDVDKDVWEGRVVTDDDNPEGFSCPNNYPAPYNAQRLRDDVKSYLAASLEHQTACAAGAYTIVATNTEGWNV
tara:strand:+ start:56 stop:298 length:243 start_codon:yes stop_codon:yes gene_type:complete